MQLLVILIALILRRVWNPPSIYRTDLEQSDLARRLIKLWQLPGLNNRSVTFNYIVITLVAVLLFAYVYYQVDHGLFGLVGVAVQAALLFLLLGPQQTEYALRDYLPKWRAQDPEALQDFIQQHFGKTVEGDVWQLHFEFWKAWVNQWLARFFTPLFWYFLLGPLALFWLAFNRSLLLKPEESPLEQRQIKINHIVQTIEQALSWAPARVLAFTFLITGNFAKVIDDVGRGLLDWKLAEADLVAESAKEALSIRPWMQKIEERITQAERQLQALRRLLYRTVSVWIGIIAGFTIIFG